MVNPKRIYWDACTWISIINEERSIGVAGAAPENRYGMCESVLQRAAEGEFEIAVSAFTLAEVCKSNAAKNEQQNKLPLFLDHEYILIIPVDKDIGLRAQVLQTSGLVGLKPADAVHLASAQRANVEEFHTFDNGILRHDGNIAAKNGNAIKICKPGEGEPLGGLFGDSGDDS